MSETLSVSEQTAEKTNAESRYLGSVPAASNSLDVKKEIMVASELEIGVTDYSRISPDHEAPEVDTPKVESSKFEVSGSHVPRPDLRMTGNMKIMSQSDRSFDNDGVSSRVEPAPGKHQILTMVAVIALATVAGAVGGAVATSALTRSNGGAETAGKAALDTKIARIDTDILALKASVEQTATSVLSQFSKTRDRFDKIEKAQAEPAAKLAKLNEAVDKLRATPPVNAMPVAAGPVALKEATGPVASSLATAAAPKIEVGRLPAVPGWVLHDVSNGGALIEGRQGIFEVYAGDPVPGLGRIDAIRRQDGRWVVVTNKGLVVAR